MLGDLGEDGMFCICFFSGNPFLTYIPETETVRSMAVHPEDCVHVLLLLLFLF